MQTPTGTLSQQPPSPMLSAALTCRTFPTNTRAASWLTQTTPPVASTCSSPASTQAMALATLCWLRLWTTSTGFASLRLLTVHRVAKMHIAGDVQSCTWASLLGGFTAACCSDVAYHWFAPLRSSAIHHLALLTDCSGHSCWQCRCCWQLHAVAWCSSSHSKLSDDLSSLRRLSLRCMQQ